MVPSRDEGGRSAIEQARHNYASAIDEAYRVNERYFLDMGEAATLLDGVLNHPVARLSLTASEAEQARSCRELYRQLGGYRFENHALEDLTGQKLMAQLEGLRSNENLRRIEQTLVGLGEHPELNESLQKIRNNPLGKADENLQKALTRLNLVLLPQPFQMVTSRRELPLREAVGAAEKSGDYIAEGGKARLKNLARGFVNDAEEMNEKIRERERRVGPLVAKRSRLMQLIEEFNSKKPTQSFRERLRLRPVPKSRGRFGNTKENKKENPYEEFISRAQQAELNRLTSPKDRAKRMEELLTQKLSDLQQEIAAQKKIVLQEKPSLPRSGSDIKGLKELEFKIRLLEKLSSKFLSDKSQQGERSAQRIAELCLTDPTVKKNFLKSSSAGRAKILSKTLDQLKAERKDLQQTSSPLKRNIRPNFFREPPKASEAEKTGSDLSKIPVIRIR